MSPEPCPHLPPARPGLDWRALHAFRDESARGEGFYRACLEYGQTLWLRGLAARSILCLDRAMGADLTGDEAVLREYPIPYAAMAWVVRHTPADVFLGNPRVHFQHYAGRMSGPRREQRIWRAWGCWALVRAVRPELPGDCRHVITEPSGGQIAAGLERTGLPGEARRWTEVLDGVGAGRLPYLESPSAGVSRQSGGHPLFP